MSNLGNFIDVRTGELRKSNGKFTQIMDKNIHVFRELLLTSPKICEMYLFLVENMDRNNAVVVSQKTLSEILKCTRQSVHKYTSYLKEKNLLKVAKSGVSLIYILNEQVVWKNSAENREYAKFSATVYISRSEQDVETNFLKEITSNEK